MDDVAIRDRADWRDGEPAVRHFARVGSHVLLVFVVGFGGLRRNLLIIVLSIVDLRDIG